MKFNLKRIVLAAAIATLAVVVLLGAKFWESKPYQEWSERQALSLLRESPWSQTQLIKMPVLGQGGGGGPIQTPEPEGSARGISPQAGSGTYAGTTSGTLTRTTAAFNASFISAKPVRMALARLGMLKGTIDVRAAEELVQNSPFEDQIVVSLAVQSTTEMIDLDSLSTGDLQDASYLELRASRRRIALQQYVPPSQSGNGQPLFLFPRNQDGRPLVTLQEKQLTFVTRFSPQLKVEQKFKLKKMLFRGELEI